MERELALTVTIDEVLFRSEDGRFSVLKASDAAGREPPLILVGDLRDTAAGETLRVRGSYEQHKTFGKRLRVQTYTPVTPATARGIARYLGSGLIEGIGSELAKRLVKHFGDKTLEVISSQSARLREVPGIGAQRAQKISAAVRSRQGEAELMSFLQSLGLGPAQSERLRKR